MKRFEPSIDVSMCGWERTYSRPTERLFAKTTRASRRFHRTSKCAVDIKYRNLQLDTIKEITNNTNK